MRIVLAFLLLPLGLALADAADPLTYVESKTGAPPSACSGKLPCVMVSDGAVVIAARSWKDWQRVELAGAPGDETDRRVLAGVRAALGKKKVKKAQVSCAAAARLPALAGLGPTRQIKVPRPTPGAAAIFSTVTPDLANAAFDSELTELGLPAQPPVFSPAELAGMTGTGLAHPRLRQRAGWMQSEKRQVFVSNYYVWSPESKDVLLVATRHDGPGAFDEDAARLAAQGQLVAVLTSKGIGQVEIDTASMCSLDLGKIPDWFPYKP